MGSPGHFLRNVVSFRVEGKLGRSQPTMAGRKAILRTDRQREFVSASLTTTRRYAESDQVTPYDDASLRRK